MKLHDSIERFKFCFLSEVISSMIMYSSLTGIPERRSNSVRVQSQSDNVQETRGQH